VPHTGRHARAEQAVVELGVEDRYPDAVRRWVPDAKCRPLGSTVHQPGGSGVAVTVNERA